MLYIQSVPKHLIKFKINTTNGILKLCIQSREYTRTLANTHTHTHWRHTEACL